MKDAQQQGSVDNEFDAAKIIVNTLEGLQKDKQERAIRFASETLGLQFPAVLSDRTSSPPAGQVPPPSGRLDAAPPARTVDIKQFTESKAPKTDQQFAAVVAYYYRFEAPPEDQKDVIEASDIENAVRLVGGRNQPKDPGMTLVNAKNNGYLDSVGRAKFRINAVGENLVAMALPGKDQPPSSGQGGGQTANKRTKASARKRAKPRN